MGKDSQDISGFDCLLPMVETKSYLAGWIVLDRYYDYGEHSYIFKTIDGGISWIRQYQSNSISLKKLSFIDQVHGWVAGNQGFVMKTDNGGEDWVVIQEEDPDVEYVTEFHFNNLLDGYMVLDYAEFMITHDGGFSWQISGTFSGMSEDMYIMQDTMIWLLMNFSGINISKDGGNTWNNFQFPYNNHNAHSLFFLDEQEGWACGGGPSLWHTLDGGENWEHLYDGEYPESYSEVIFTDSVNGWLVGQYGSIMHGPGLYTVIPENQGVIDQNLSIYPNPAKTTTTITVPELNPGRIYSISVYNVTGRQVMSKQLNDMPGSCKIDVSSYQPGIYILVVTQEGRIVHSGKFIVL